MVSELGGESAHLAIIALEGVRGGTEIVRGEDVWEGFQIRPVFRPDCCFFSFPFIPLHNPSMGRLFDDWGGAKLVTDQGIVDQFTALPPIMARLVRRRLTNRRVVGIRKLPEGVEAGVSRECTPVAYFLDYLHGAV